jgi:hypothetical protein
MKYLLMFIDTEETNRRTAEQSAQFHAKTMAWWGEHAAAGRILSGEQLKGPDTATTVRLDGDKVTIVDGPFIEAKESIAGYGVVDVDDLDQALEMARTWPFGGAVEVRPVMVRPAMGDVRQD